MTMKIAAVHIHKKNLELVRPYTIAYKTVTSVENVIVQLVLSGGIVGYGAANPSKPVVGVSVDDSFHTLQQDDFSWLLGRDIREYRQLCHEVRLRYAADVGAVTALDIALHDAFTKYLDIPLVKFLGQKIQALPTSITIGIKGVEETLLEAEEYLARHFQILKVKIGRSLEEDVERLFKLRERFGHRVRLRVDANQGYDTETLKKFVGLTSQLELELIEQPLPASAIEDMKSLPDSIKSVLAADESLLTTADALTLLLPPKACAIFNIKLMKCGGITGACEIATLAELAHLNLMWGCNDESAISIAAALHTAFAYKATKYLDLDGSLDLARDVVSGGFELKDGLMRPLERAGLGIEAYLEG
jgi:L-alanine-DL-glutamate epimerase-like enolase superfamily enzyme